MKKLMKKIISCLLLAAMVLGLLAGCGGDSGSGETIAAESGNYEQKISFTMTNWYSMVNANAGYDLDEDAYVQWVLEKFNVEIDAWALPSASDSLSTTRLWLNAGTVPECFMINTTMPMTELRQYIDLGMLKPLPENWKEQWPNLAAMTQATGYLEAVTIDGLTYAIPHATYYGYEEYDPLPEHKSIHFRRDWAAKVGMADLGADGTIKLSELATYLKKVAEAGLCSKPYLAGTISNALPLFKLANGMANDSDFVKTDSGYVWQPATEEYIKVIEQINEWYDTGLLDPDAYVTDSDTAWEEYKNGLSPAIYNSGSVGVYHDMLNDVLKRSGHLPSDSEERARLCDVYAMAAIESEDGTVYSNAVENYYTMHAFSPNCDDATMVRILDMMDYFCTSEGQIGAINGIPGVDWELDADGNYVVLNEELGEGEYASASRFFAVWGTADDSISSIPGVSGYHVKEQEMVRNLYKVKENGVVFPINMDIVLLDTDAKNNYSAGVASRVTSLVISSNDIAGDWAAFIREYKVMYEPVLEDLNNQ